MPLPTLKPTLKEKTVPAAVPAANVTLLGVTATKEAMSGLCALTAAVRHQNGDARHPAVAAQVEIESNV